MLRPELKRLARRTQRSRRSQIAIIETFTRSLSVAAPQSEPRAATAVADIRAVLNKQAEAWNRGDIADSLNELQGYNGSAGARHVSTM